MKEELSFLEKLILDIALGLLKKDTRTLQSFGENGVTIENIEKLKKKLGIGK